MHFDDFGVDEEITSSEELISESQEQEQELSGKPCEEHKEEEKQIWDNHSLPDAFLEEQLRLGKSRPPKPSMLLESNAM